MFLTKLLLENFRSHQKTLFEFDPKTNLIIGPNGSGKTNILESIYLLSHGKSFRSSSLSKLIMWNSSYSSVRGKLSINNELSELEVQLTNDPAKTAVTRKLLINKAEKLRKEFIGQIKTVIFHPDDIRLVAGSPGRRRDFLDEIFMQSEWRYSSALSQYNRALKHRNELLDLIRCGKNNKSELYYWDQSLIKNDKIIHDFRLSFIKHLNNFFQNHPDLEISTISINYFPSFLTQEKIDQNYSRELECGYTQSGLHRDDFSFDNSVFHSADKNLASWGSRGQQRLATFTVRLGQIDYLETKYQESPILLLDDIFSELDENHQKLIGKICQKYQTIFTSSEPESVDILPSAKIIQL